MTTTPPDDTPDASPPAHVAGGRDVVPFGEAVRA